MGDLVHQCVGLIEDCFNWVGLAQSRGFQIFVPEYSCLLLPCMFEIRGAF